MTDSAQWGTLYVVATPIGNLEDITFRAIRILKEVDLVAAEDTRHSRKLFNHFGIETNLTSCYEHNESQKMDYLLGLLQQGQSIALISDAGTPAISDPGNVLNESQKMDYLLGLLQQGQSIALISDAGTPAISDPGNVLVQHCRNGGVTVLSVPGPSACISALSVAGLPTDRFCFDGFLPPKTVARCRALQPYLTQKRTVAIARELTKLHEELFRGTVTEAIDHFSQARVRGEIVLLLAPAVEAAPTETVREALERLSLEGDLPMKAIVKQVAKTHGISGSDVYQESLRLQGKCD
ncbi:MAG: hypothetical protein B6I37_01220 [Desulfobacteraceae bacterium 4572_35.2]|nr:MAG: hypothetical protein B6I37_01220 [Desulfobacteraceae bacterium 4572_35.2]